MMKDMIKVNGSDMMDVIFENDVIRVCDTGRSYDFIGTIENKTDSNIKVLVEFVDEYDGIVNMYIINGDEDEDDYIYDECYEIDANDWVGILAGNEGYATINSVVYHNENVKDYTYDDKEEHEMEKEAVREQAIEWQMDFDNHDYSWGELCEFGAMFEEKGRQYGLLAEFRENAIC